MADYLNIAGRIRTTASDGVSVEASEVFDESLEKSQSEINNVVNEVESNYLKQANSTAEIPGATIKKILDQDGNQILPMTSTSAVISPNGTTTIESRMQYVEDHRENAYEIAVRNGFVGTEQEWLNSLKATVGEFKFAEYDSNAPSTIGGTATTISGITASADTMSKMLLMPNAASSPTATRMYVTNQSGTSYVFVYNGDLNFDNKFSSGQSLNQVAIDKSRLEDPAEGSLAKAEDAMQLKAKLMDIDYIESKDNTSDNFGKYIKDGKPYNISTNPQNYAYRVIDVSGCKRVRFIGIEYAASATAYAGYAFYNNSATEATTDGTGMMYSVTYPNGRGNASIMKEYVVTVPFGAKWLFVTSKNAIITSFYCYLEYGETVLEEVKNIYGKIIPGSTYIKVIVDKNNRFLFGIHEDGSIEWSKGIPTPIKNALLNKVNIEPDKSLIPNQFIEEVGLDTSVWKLLDSENRVLLSIEKDGSFNWSKGVPQHLKDFILDNVSNSTVTNDAMRGVAKSLVNTLFPISIDKDNEGWEVIKTVQQNSCLYLASKFLMKWTPLKTVPKRVSGNYTAGVEVTGIPYASVGDRQVGFDVRFETFMTAVNNPYSLLYTEITSRTDSTSIWGNIYTGSSVSRTYYGSVCSHLTCFCTGFDDFYLTGSHPWMRDYMLWIGQVNDNDIDKIKVGDIINFLNKEETSGHCRLITGIQRDQNNRVTNVKITEMASPGGKESTYTRQQVLDYINVGGGDTVDSDSGHGTFYRSLLMYATNQDIEQEFFSDSYEYNNDICTYAGNKACFMAGSKVVLNYNLRNDETFAYQSVEIYKDNEILNTILLSEIDQTTLPEGQRNHAIDLGTGLEPGVYKARLTSENNTTSDYTTWEVVGIEISYDKKDDTFSFDFNTSENTIKVVCISLSKPGNSICRYPISNDENKNNHVDINFKEFCNQQRNIELAPGEYNCSFLCKGEFGRKFKTITINI